MEPKLIDASSAIYAWDNYPIEIFGTLWCRFIGQQIKSGLIKITETNIKEVEKSSPDCYKWLKENNISSLRATNNEIQEVNKLSSRLGIQNSKYRAGVNYNDLLLIATAYTNEREVITNEACQPSRPKVKANYKIPLVCMEICCPPIKTFSFIKWLKDKNPTL